MAELGSLQPLLEGLATFLASFFPALGLSSAKVGSGWLSRRVRKVTSLRKIGTNKCQDTESYPNTTSVWHSGFNDAFVTVLWALGCFPTTGLPSADVITAFALPAPIAFKSQKNE